MEEVVLRILMVSLGAVMVWGGAAFALESLEAQRAAFHSIALSAGSILVGMALCVWGLKGIP